MRDARRAWPDDYGFQKLALVSALARGNSNAVEAVAREALAKADKLEKEDELGKLESPAKKDCLAVATWGALATRMEGWQKVGERYAGASRPWESNNICLHLDTREAELDPGRGKASFQKRWKELNPSSWDRRLLEGDVQVFNEILAGRWSNLTNSSGLLDLLESEEEWKKSLLPNLITPLNAERCEAWLLEARRKAVEGDAKGRLECLQHCVKTHATGYWEYWEAVFLLKQERAKR